MEPYRSLYPNVGMLLPETERLCERVISFPTGTAINAEHITRICEVVRRARESAGEIRAKLAAS
jgi:dTDP-4-amino-4,6-dideoxygalactose transaminase